MGGGGVEKREREQLITRLAAPLNWKHPLNSVLIISVDTSCLINVGLYFMDSVPAAPTMPPTTATTGNNPFIFSSEHCPSLFSHPLWHLCFCFAWHLRDPVSLCSIFLGMFTYFSGQVGQKALYAGGLCEILFE